MSGPKGSRLWLHLSTLGMEMCCFYVGLAITADRLGRDLLPF